MSEKSVELAALANIIRDEMSGHLTALTVVVAMLLIELENEGKAEISDTLRLRLDELKSSRPFEPEHALRQESFVNRLEDLLRIYDTSR